MGKRKRDEMGSKKLVLGASQVVCLLVLILFLIPMFVFDFFSCKDECLLYMISSPAASQDIKDGDGAGRGGAALNYTSLLRRLLQGANQTKLDNTGFACSSKSLTVACVTTKPISIDSRTDQVHLRQTPLTGAVDETIKVWPYPWFGGPLKSITPIKIYTATTVAPPPCQYNHHVPLVIFSVGGHSDKHECNQFHDFDEVIVPLFVTSRLFQSQVQFMITDYKPSVVKRYSKILSGLTSYPIISPGQVTKVHCFPGAVIGLKCHTFLGLNSYDAPLGYSMLDFKEFLREIYSIKVINVTEIVNIEKPLLILIGRDKSRRLVNEDKMVKMMEDLGFRVKVARDREVANMDMFSKTLGLCSVLVGVHGAGLANQVFLPDGALVVQLVPLGLDWASSEYLGKPAERMGLRYLEYKIEPIESTLYEKYGPDSPEIKDPDSFFAKGFQVGRKIYILEQNIKVNIGRFKASFVEALRVKGTTALSLTP